MLCDFQSFFKFGVWEAASKLAKLAFWVDTQEPSKSVQKLDPDKGLA